MSQFIWHLDQFGQIFGCRGFQVALISASVNVAFLDQHGFTKSALFYASCMSSGITSLGEKMQSNPDGRGESLEETEGAW